MHARPDELRRMLDGIRRDRETLSTIVDAIDRLDVSLRPPEGARQPEAELRRVIHRTSGPVKRYVIILMGVIRTMNEARLRCVAAVGSLRSAVDRARTRLDALEDEIKRDLEKGDRA